MNNTTAQNNTAVVPLVGGQATMSNILHGSCHAASEPNSNCTTTGTQLTGTKDISNNYIDDSGGSAFYSNSFKVGGGGSALAWTCGGNKRMTTGASIDPC